MNWLLLGVAAVVTVAVGIAGTLAGYPETWLACGVLVVLVAAHGVYDAFAARNAANPSLREPGGDGQLPAAHVEQADHTPLGDTSEVHDELSPVDLPPGDPARRELREHRRR